MSDTFPFPYNGVVAADIGGTLAGDLGKVFRRADGKAYRLVKAAANIAAAAKKVLVSAISSGAPTWAVNTTTTANDAHVVGIVPSDIVTVSDTASQIDSGSYFFVQVSGAATGIAATTGIADNGLIGTSTTAGSIDDASVAAGVGAIGTATAASTAASADVTVFLKGLI